MSAFIELLLALLPRGEWRVRYCGGRTRWMSLDSALDLRSMWGGQLEKRQITTHPERK